MLQKISTHLRKKNKGFTLVELVVVIAILAILAAIAVPQLLGFQNRAKEQADRQTAAQLKNTMALLYANKEAVPAAAGADFNVGGAAAPDVATASYTAGELREISTVNGVDTPTNLDEADVEALITELMADWKLQSGKVVRVTITGSGAVSADLVNP